MAKAPKPPKPLNDEVVKPETKPAEKGPLRTEHGLGIVSLDY